jgi:hypothetical protein
VFSWALLCWSAVFLVGVEWVWCFAGEMRDAHAVWL